MPALVVCPPCANAMASDLGGKLIVWSLVFLAVLIWFSIRERKRNPGTLTFRLVPGFLERDSRYALLWKIPVLMALGSLLALLLLKAWQQA